MANQGQLSLSHFEGGREDERETERSKGVREGWVAADRHSFQGGGDSGKCSFSVM